MMMMMWLSLSSGHLVCQQFIWAKLNNSVYYFVWLQVRAAHALHLFQKQCSWGCANYVPGVVPGSMFCNAEEPTVAECVRFSQQNLSTFRWLKEEVENCHLLTTTLLMRGPWGKVTRNIGPMFFFVDLIYIKTEKNKILKNFLILVVQKLHFFLGWPP